MFLHQKYFVTRINVITEFGKKWSRISFEKGKSVQEVRS
jgi:hypothetical protein